MARNYIAPVLQRATILRHCRNMHRGIVVPLCVVIALLFLILQISFSSSSIHSTIPKRRAWNSRIPGSHKPIKWKKWIVVTTVNYPTGDLKKLAALPDWKLCVVADTKTPKDWRLDEVHYLSVEDQQALQLQLPQKLPFKSYTRKAVGYLYAIQNGAEWIYDTDDDNKPYGKGLEQFDYVTQVSGMRFKAENNSEQNVFNPYRYFGRSDIWPRGYPLEYIRNTDPETQYESCAKIQTSAVQQGLVHKDPDVDAIYRLLNADRSTGLNVGFDVNAPPITLDIGTYAPWNSQNTLFHRDAFFTMFLPTTVEFRATDIWRSFYSQKLLHLIGRTIAFYPVNAIQIRNAHNYLDDFKDERAVYEKAGDIIRFLQGWECTRNSTSGCAYELAVEFGNRHFWEEDDVKLLKLWLDDLEAIGYTFPPLVNVTDSPDSACRRAYLHFTAENLKTATELAEEKLRNMEDIIDWCGMDYDQIGEDEDDDPSNETYVIGSSSFTVGPLLYPNKIARKHKKFEDKRRTALVLVNNFPWQKGIGLLQRLYSGYFAHLVFCGTYFPAKYNLTGGLPKTKTPFSYIHLDEKEIFRGHFHYYCIPKINELRLQNIDGYFFVGDDVIFNFWNKNNLSMFGNIFDGINNAENWWASKGGKNATARLKNMMSTKYKNDEEKQSLWRKYIENIRQRRKEDPEKLVFETPGKIYADLLYVPSHGMQYASAMYSLFREADMFLEIAAKRFYFSIDYEKFDQKKEGIYLWLGERDHYERFYTEDIQFLHPVKFSFLVKEQPRKIFCESIVTMFVKKLFKK